MSSVSTYNTSITEAPPTQTTLDTGSFIFRELSEKFKYIFFEEF